MTEMINFFPEIDKGNTDLQQLLEPFNNQLNELINYSNDVRNFMSWTETHAKFLGHVNSILGFELLDLPFSNESDLRNFLKWITWIYKRKGTEAGAVKIIELLGFDYTWTENFPDFVPFIINFHKLWGRSLIINSVFFDDFSGNLSNWSNLNLVSFWRIVSGRYYGTGSGGDLDTNASVFSDSKSTYYFEVDFELIQNWADNREFGIYLKYVDVDNWVRLEIQRDGASVVTLVLTKEVSGAPTSLSLGTISTDISTGIHKLWIWNDGSDNWTVGINDITIEYNEAFTGITNGTKGLWVNEDLTVAFDNVNVEELNFEQIAKLYSSSFTDREVEIGLIKDPSYENIEDSFIISSTPDVNNGSSVDIEVHADDTRRGILRRPNVLATIGRDDIVQTGTLRLYVNSITGTTITIGVHRVLKPWLEDTVTWNDWDEPDNEWGTAGCENDDDTGEDNSGDGTGFDRHSTALDSKVITATGWVEFDITDLVKEWYDESSLENGVILIATAGDAQIKFDSSNGTGNIPQIVIETNNKNSKENYLKQILPFYLPAGVTITWI